jgi:hypothetical protein
MSGQPISGHKGRDQFICAILTRDVLPLLEVRVAVRLGIFFNCKTGKCDPGYDTLARELGISRRTLFRAIARLKADGWIAIQRVGGDEHVQFSLFIPPQLGSPNKALPTGGDNMLTPQEVTENDGRGDTMLSPQEVPGEVTENGVRGDRNRGVEVTDRLAAQKNLKPENLKSAAHAARTSRVDRESDDNTATDGPVARAAHAPLTDHPESQKQPPPSRVPEIGTAVTNGHAPPTTSPFAQVLSVYPEDRVGNEAKAYWAFERALDARGSLHVVLEDIASLMQNYDDDVPFLADLLETIERMP